MKRALVAAGAASALLVGGMIAPSFAAGGDSSLSGSDFEIEADANIKVDTATSGVDDWVEVPSSRIKADKPSGKDDDSFGQGSKEDTAVPTVVSGSIPPNKSDLKEFGTYQEGNTQDGFFHLFWSRVQDPSGTTNMDFELNQSEVLTANGVTPERTAGDLLITYDLEKGGKLATISKREWNGSKWGPATAFGSGDAIGTINTTEIPAEAGLGAYSPRTFGEASVRLSSLFGDTTECKTFGTAYVKSRSSDSFTAALKDFIAPVGIDLTNCGTVKIIKTDDAGSPLAGAEFTLYEDNAPVGGARGAEDTITSLACTTAVTTGVCTIKDVPFGDYWAVETVVPPGYDPAADQNFALSGAVQTVELTFVNPRQRGAIEVSKTYGDAIPQQGVKFTVSGNGITPVEVTTDASGKACVDGLLFGDYTVTETVPPGFKGEGPKQVTVDNKADCTSGGGETVSFVNIPLSQIAVGFRPEVAGLTSATITCAIDDTSVNGTSIDNVLTDGDPYVTASRFVSLEPGTYLCSVKVSLN